MLPPKQAWSSSMESSHGVMESSSAKMESSLPELYATSLVPRPVPPPKVTDMSQDALKPVVQLGNQVSASLTGPFLQDKPSRKPPQ